MTVVISLPPLLLFAGPARYNPGYAAGADHHIEHSPFTVKVSDSPSPTAFAPSFAEPQFSRVEDAIVLALNAAVCCNTASGSTLTVLTRFWPNFFFFFLALTPGDRQRDQPADGENQA